MVQGGSNALVSELVYADGVLIGNVSDLICQILDDVEHYASAIAHGFAQDKYYFFQFKTWGKALL